MNIDGYTPWLWYDIKCVHHHVHSCVFQYSNVCSKSSRWIIFLLTPFVRLSCATITLQLLKQKTLYFTYRSISYVGIHTPSHKYPHTPQLNTRQHEIRHSYQGNGRNRLICVISSSGPHMYPIRKSE